VRNKIHVALLNVLVALIVKHVKPVNTASIVLQAVVAGFVNNNRQKEMENTEQDKMNQLIKLNQLVKVQKDKLFGGGMTDEILSNIDSLCQTQDDAIYLLNTYQKVFNSDLVDELKKLNSGYNSIKRNVSKFIELGVIEENYPHNLRGSSTIRIKQGMFSSPFSFDGRIRRTEYGISLIIFVIVRAFVDSGLAEAEVLTIFITYIPMLWFIWAQSAKRCHDIGNNGWWQLVPLYVLWMLFRNGQPGLNKYGVNPKDRPFAKSLVPDL
jgi:uncharacterized membrane protein YhaH (DUF805 family)